MHIFAYGEKFGLSSNIRIIAGYTLKSSLPLLFSTESNDDKCYIRACVLQTLIDPLVQIRNASGVITTQIVLLSGLEMWPELMPALMELLKSNNKDYIVTALSCLSKMMEDNIYEFEMNSELVRLFRDRIPASP